MREPLEREELLDKGYIELLDLMPHPLTGISPDNTVVNAARISYLGDSKGNEADKKLLFYLMRHRHWTPFEHPTFQFRVKCPLFIARQWFRHRTHHYNELSRRYTDKNMEFYSTLEWRTQDSVNEQGSKGLIENQAYASTLNKYIIDIGLLCYQTLIQMGVAKEQARMLLPQSLYTEFYDTVDLRNLLHFISLRNEEHAQYEIQVYGSVLLNWVDKYAPWTGEAFRKYVLEEDE